MSPRIRTYRDLEGGDSDLGRQVARQHARVTERLVGVGDVVAVMSGKGGVGKSLLTGVLATALADRGLRVAVVDADLNGPSTARMLGIDPRPLATSPTVMLPLEGAAGIALISTSFLLRDDEPLAWREPGEAGFVWRGALERTTFREFLSDVDWGTRDVMLVDLPPGTQRLVELHELVPDLGGALAVTTPSPASRDAVARSMALARARALPLLGLIENLSGYRCGECGAVGTFHAGSAGHELAEAFQVPLLGRLPFDPSLDRAAASGGFGEWLAEEAGVEGTVRSIADALVSRLGRSGGAT